MYYYQLSVWANYHIVMFNVSHSDPTFLESTLQHLYAIFWHLDSLCCSNHNGSLHNNLSVRKRRKSVCWQSENVNLFGRMLKLLWLMTALEPNLLSRTVHVESNLDSSKQANVSKYGILCLNASFFLWFGSFGKKRKMLFTLIK